MRAVCFVKRLNWELPGTVFRHGLTFGDVDNDGDNELVVGTAEGDLFIFKGPELWQKISGLGLISCVTVGDVFNYGRNALVIICGDGWAHIYYSPRSVNLGIITTIPKASLQKNTNMGLKTDDDIPSGHAESINPTIVGQKENSKEIIELHGKMECVHVQRIPTNTKVVLVTDIDKDGLNEMIIGLTDRVVRSYRWSSNADLGSGKLVGLNKWECANQIGTVTMQHAGDGTPTLLVAQPGGTFMRIMCNPDDCHLEDGSSDTSSEAAASCVDYQTLCISRMRNANISTEILGNLEPGLSNFISKIESRINDNTSNELPEEQLCLVNRKLNSKSFKSASLEFLGKNDIKSNKRKCSSDSNQCFEKEIFVLKGDLRNLCCKEKTQEIDQVDGNLAGGNIILGEYGTIANKKSLLPSYDDFTNFSHNNHDSEHIQNVRDEVQKRDYSEHNKREGSILNNKPYALATLDGTIMLVKDEMILWSMQVDHHIFALYRLDVTRDGADEIIACTWDGQTYILDQQRNSVRFQFEEPVRAFCSGMYSVTSGMSTPSLVYNTFNNKMRQVTSAAMS
ncbi:KICSTOR complex protein ITFG2-like isoform X2 [Belonocnema kinseyi]|uniref:KICSTOR complex protein ITFG2-like isoform X2 n=1 Tax=Belonocnema kinseyi TaxID=2817044 RepID=UPI00143D9449|nr:KICSTOR complex protein ITFG2-like isoform X2 [Belonocnema kinseyi]